jgi:O-antigen ligase
MIDGAREQACSLRDDGRGRNSGAAAATALLGGVLVALHVVVDPAAYDVSQMPRLLALLVALLAAVPLTLLLPAIARRLDWSPLRSPLVIAAAVSLVLCCLTLAFATNVSAGLTDLFRSLAAFVVLGLCLVLLPLHPRWRERLLETSVVAALVTVGVGGWEVWPLAAAGLPGRRDLEMAFLDGMMSNVNLFAGYLLLLMPWCICATAVLSGAWRGVAGATAAAGLALLVMLQSRAAWLALGVAALVTAATILRHARQLQPARWLTMACVAGLTAIPVAAAAIGGLAFTETAAGRAIHRLLINRPHQADGPTDGGRTIAWGIAADMLADHPLTGVGPGNFTIHFPEYLRPPRGSAVRDLSSLSSDNWIHPHNDLLEVAAEQGLPGLVALAAVFLLALVAIRRVLCGSPTVADARLATASLAAIIGLLVFSCLDFPLDRVSHQVVLAVHLAVVVLLDRDQAAGATAPPRRLPAWLLLPPLIAALALGTAYATAALRQEHAVLDARRAQHAGDWQAMRDAARRATTPWKTLDPLAVPVAVLEGLAERQLGNLPAATACFERALVANPNRLYVLQNLGAAYVEAGRLDDAIDIFAIAADRYPDRIELRHNLAMALVEAERFPEAVAVIEDVPEPVRTEGMRGALLIAHERAAADFEPGRPDETAAGREP